MADICDNTIICLQDDVKWIIGSDGEVDFSIIDSNIVTRVMDITECEDYGYLKYISFPTPWGPPEEFIDALKNKGIPFVFRWHLVDHGNCGAVCGFNGPKSLSKEWSLRKNITDEFLDKFFKQASSELSSSNIDSSSLSSMKKIWKFDVNDDESVTITSYKGKEKEVVVPSVIGEYKVKTIGENAFSNTRGITVVNIGSGVKEIRNSAFDGCSELESLVLPNTLKKIGEEVFNDCNALHELAIPDSLTSIKSFPPVLKKIEVSENHKAIRVKNSVIYNKNYTKILGIVHDTDKYVIEGTVKNIPAYLFWNIDEDETSNSICSATLLDGIQTIGESAFEFCEELTEVNLPSSITKIAGSAFRGTGIKKITIPGSCKVIKGGWSYGCPRGAFAYCSSLEEVVIEEGVEVIESAAFLGCIKLKTVSLPSTITKISRDAFEDCPASVIRKVSKFSQEIIKKEKSENVPIGEQKDLNSDSSIENEDNDNINEEIYGFEWKTEQTIRIIDSTFGVPLYFGVAGLIVLEKSDFGEKSTCSIKENDLKKLVIDLVSINIVPIMKENNMSLFEVDKCLNDVSNQLLTKLTTRFEELGISITEFKVNCVNLPKDDPNYKRIKKLKNM